MGSELLKLILRQILSNQFTILKWIQKPQDITSDKLEKRLKHTDEILNKLYNCE